MQQDVLRGEVVRWRMQPKADSQWHIVEVLGEDEQVHTVTGCALPRPGTTVELRGEWQQSDRWGPQFHARAVLKARPPLNPEGVARWLRERCEGIGPKRAEQLLAAFGNAQQLWAAMEKPDAFMNDDRLAGIAWLTPDIARAITEAYAAEGQDGEYQALMHGWGMTQRQIAKVKRHWSLDEATKLLTDNPYLLADHIDGFGFNRADEVAKKLGITHNHPSRVNAALLHFIDAASGEGHVFVDEVIMRQIARQTRLPMERLMEGVRVLREQKRLIVKDGARIYTPELFRAEWAVAIDLRERFGERTAAAEEEDLSVRVVESAGGKTTSDPWQQRAIELLADMSKRIVFVTGGPGTGKTTVLRDALAQLRAQGVPVMLAAPTGKAAKRMMEATGMKASTLHALLGYRPTRDIDCDVCRDQSAEFDYSTINSAEPRLVVVDEASMVDLRLWEALATQAHGVRLAFVGDAHQLPPVGPGQPFADALSVAPPDTVVRLRTVFRSKGEWVKLAAPQILAGTVPSLEPAPGLRFVECAAAEHVVGMVSQLVQGAYDNQHFRADAATALGHMPILSPQRTGAAGVSAINRALHDMLNPGDFGDPCVELEDKNALRMNSWVMITKNDNRKRVCNGDTGYVVAIDEKTRALTIEVEGSDSQQAVYTASEAREQLRLAYASTVHKSQGSEYPWVVVVCHSSHKRMLTRRLLYTAVTRAKEGVVLLGDRAGIEWAVENAREVQRCTWLAKRIKEAA